MRAVIQAVRLIGSVFHALEPLKEVIRCQGCGCSILYHGEHDAWPQVEGERLPFRSLNSMAGGLRSTVGYGDLHPSTPASRAFTLFFIIYGIVVPFASLASLLATIMDRAGLRFKQAMACMRLLARRRLRGSEPRAEVGSFRGVRDIRAQ